MDKEIDTEKNINLDGFLEEYFDREREEIMDIMLSLFDEETLMKNHDATIERKVRKEALREGRREGRREGGKEISDLFNYLLKNNRGDDAIRASEDEGFREQLLEEFRSGKLTKEPKL